MPILGRCRVRVRYIARENRREFWKGSGDTFDLSNAVLHASVLAREVFARHRPGFQDPVRVSRTHACMYVTVMGGGGSPKAVSAVPLQVRFTSKVCTRAALN